MQTATVNEVQVSFEVGQNAISVAFGEGKITQVDGDIVTVKFEDGQERKLKAEFLAPAPLLEELYASFQNCWVRGSAWRLEAGKLLYQIKQRCAHSEWGAFLGRYELSRSTADDYVRRYQDEADIIMPRQIVSEPEPDPQAEKRTEQISAEQAKRVGKKPTHHASELHVRVKDLLPHQMDVYREERKENRERVDAIWKAAFYQIIGSEQVYPPLPGLQKEAQANVADLIEDVLSEQEAVQC